MKNRSFKIIFALITFVISLSAIILIGWFLLSEDNKDETTQLPEIETKEKPDFYFEKKIIGKSLEGREIEAYIFGEGENKFLFVGGIHGGYEWNSVLLAYQFIDYFDANHDVIPKETQITIIPVLNPDGLYTVTESEGRFTALDVKTDLSPGSGRFNANGVDLNRNFACNWAPESSWRGEIVSAGDYAFSEPEAVALRDYVNQFNPDVVVFWHSKANNVYASECNQGVLPKTELAMNLYANSAGYGSVLKFDAYPITGDAEGWLASIGIPALTVELETRNDIEWAKNLAGVKALLKADFSN